MYTIDECQNDINLLKGVIKGLKALPDQVNQSNLPEVKLSIHEICTNIKSMSSQEGSLKLESESYINWYVFEELNIILNSENYDHYINTELLEEFKKLLPIVAILLKQLETYEKSQSHDAETKFKLNHAIELIEGLIDSAENSLTIENEDQIKEAFAGYAEKRIKEKDTKTDKVNSTGAVISNNESPLKIKDKTKLKKITRKKQDDRRPYIQGLDTETIKNELEKDKESLKASKKALEESLNRLSANLKLCISISDDVISKGSFRTTFPGIYELFETVYLGGKLSEICTILSIDYGFSEPDETIHNLIFDAIADTGEIDKKSETLKKYKVEPWIAARAPIYHSADTEKALKTYGELQSESKTSELKNDFNEHAQLAHTLMSSSPDPFELQCTYLKPLSSSLNNKLPGLYRDRKSTCWPLHSIIGIILTCIEKLENLIKTTEQSALVPEIKAKQRFYRQLILPIKQIGQLVRQLPNSLETNNKLHERKYLDSKKISKEDYTLFKEFTEIQDQKNRQDTTYDDLLFFNQAIKAIRGKLAHGKPVQAEDLEESCQRVVSFGRGLYSRLQEYVSSNLNSSNSNSNSNTTPPTTAQTAQPAQGFSN